MEKIAETDVELSVLDGYAAWAERYDEEDNPLALIEGPAIMEACGNVAGLAVLDVGCGTGRHSLPLIEAGAKVVGIDFSPEMLAVARRRSASLFGATGSASAEFHQHSLPGPFPFADQSFDLVIMGLVIEHVADLDAVMRETHRVLKTGGRCLVSALHPERTAAGQRARFLDPATGLRTPIATIHRTEEEYLAPARAAGFDIEESKTLLGTAELAARSPRGAKYVGLPLGWIGVFRKL
jgi:ubiquinone/menaquinone biosynthesis C-methylase UbiE